MQPDALLDHRLQPTMNADAGWSAALRVHLLLNPDVALATWVPSPGRAVVDFLRVPEHRRRRGLGTRTYLLWEASLAPGTVVELDGLAEAVAFWRSLGFTGEGRMTKRLD